MSCCGEPKEQNTNNGQASHVVNSITNQQPLPNPGFEKPLFQQPTISPPPPAHTYDLNTISQSGGWGTSPSPPPAVNQFGSYTQSATPLPVSASTFNESVYNGSNGFSMNEPLVRPGSAHQPWGPGSPPPHMMLSPPPRPHTQSPPLDEGKMSISIDFGMSVGSHVVLSTYSYPGDG